MAPEVSNCCGFSLKHGTIIIGVLQSIFAFVFLILSAAYAEHPHELVDMSDPSIVPDVSTLRSILITIAVWSALLCTFSIFLIFGAETKRPKLFIPWLILNPLAVAIYLISTLTAILYHAGDDNAIFICGHLVLATIVILFNGYKFLVVHGFYKHLKSLNF